MNDILILTTSEDPHADNIIKHFEEFKVNYFRLNTDLFPFRYTITYQASNDKYFISDQEKKLLIEDNTVIWNRRVVDPNFPSPFEENFKSAVFGESHKTLEGLLMSHKGLVVNNPLSDFAANNKIHQLKLAKSLGFLVPDTILTTDEKVAKEFYYKYKGDIIFKTQKGVGIGEAGNERVVYTNKVKESNLEQFNLIKNNPCLFQENVPKKYEARITTIGKKVLGVAIYTQMCELSRHDMRRYDFRQVKYEPLDVPNNVKTFCLEIMSYYNLYFGAFDFIIRPDNEYIFLEINPRGQWLWTEHLSGLDISKEIASYLAFQK